MNTQIDKPSAQKELLQLSFDFSAIFGRDTVPQCFNEASVSATVTTHELTLATGEHPVLESQSQPTLEFGEWNDQEILLLMEGVLITTLRSLSDGRCAIRERQEAMDWMMSDDLLPFSFSVCCRAIGYDHEQLREAVLSSIKRTTH